MSTTIQTDQPAAAVRSHSARLSALLVIATIAIVGLTVTVVVQATGKGHATTASAPAHASAAAIRANPSAEAGARLDHRGLKGQGSSSAGLDDAGGNPSPEKWTPRSGGRTRPQHR